MKIKLEYINGYIFVEPLGNKKVIQSIQQGRELLDKLKVNYWFSAGTALGLVRESCGWIKHDTDIDAEIYVTEKEIPGLVLHEFRAEGYRLIRTTKFKNKIMQYAFMNPMDNIIFDIYFYYDDLKHELLKEDNCIANFNDSGILWMPIEMIRIKDVARGFPLPYPAVDYLTLRYGNWRKPRSIKSSWSDDACELLIKC